MSQGPINFGDVGDIDMWPDETGALMRRFQAAGRAFADQLPAAQRAIDDGEKEANTGFDTLSKNFRASYNAGELDLETLSKNVQPLLDRMGALGLASVGKYVEQAARDAARMKALDGDLPAPPRA
jgi:hypothetical protein